MKEVELLEDIKKKEESSDRRIADAQTKAEKAIASARQKAQEELERAKVEEAENYERLMQRTAKQAEEQHADIVDLARKKAQKIKRADAATVLVLFKKAVKQRFGV